MALQAAAAAVLVHLMIRQETEVPQLELRVVPVVEQIIMVVVAVADKLE
jgi:hypothetical protein